MIMLIPMNQVTIIMVSSRATNNWLNKLLVLVGIIALYAVSFAIAHAASLTISPSTGVYGAGSTFTVRVQVNTGGQSVNAAEGTLSYNPKELSVVSVNRTGSIFNLWVAEPSFSNSAGTISFSGGLPSGYSGTTGTIMNVTFRAVGSGSARVNFKNGSVLANDGRGTNILTSMNGGTYTIQAKTETPEPEIIEYIAPANTPAAPIVTSDTHADTKSWYTSNKAILNWSLPPGITAVRTLLDQNPTTVPTKVYENPISTITLDDLPEGESYFHIQFKNADGWGRVTHFRLAVDSERPTKIDIAHAEGSNLANPEQKLLVTVVDETSGVNLYKVKLDEAEPYEVRDETGSGTIVLPSLKPGYHSVFIEAFDQAGNSIIGTFSFTIESFSKPVFTEYPTEINEEVIPVIKGQTRPNAKVQVTLSKVGGEPALYEVSSDQSGNFIFIPEGTFSLGVYELRAQATDEFGAQSEWSDKIRIAVQQPGYLKIGSILVSILSVLVPLVVLLVVMILGSWYLWLYVKRFRRRVQVESVEALEILSKEFSELQTILRSEEAAMRLARKTNKLTKAETAMVQSLDLALQSSQRKVQKEIEDIAELTRKKKGNE